ncbi:MAG: biotin/lipoyl-binding protein, partial [Porticoccaceae bacterium]|nr:biotin/lipoyl-binding protein [Porticoccaceae bacterium]
MNKSNKGIPHSIVSPMAAAIVGVEVKIGQMVEQGEIIATIES